MRQGSNYINLFIQAQQNLLAVEAAPLFYENLGLYVYTA